MMWDLPTEIQIGEQIYHITKKCDYRVVLDVIIALNDEEMTTEEKVICGLLLFYEELTRENIRFCPHLEQLQKEMFSIINGGEEQEENQEQKPQLMDWQHDFPQLAPPISRVLGYDVRTPDKYTHWYSFLGGYMEIGECTFSTIVSIRSKRAKGKKLDNWEQEYIREHRKMVELPRKLTAEEQEFLDSDW